MELREFTESPDYSAADLREIADRYRAFLEDGEHTL